MALYINTTKVGSTAYMGSTKLNKIKFNGTEVWTGLPAIYNTLKEASSPISEAQWLEFLNAGCVALAIANNDQANFRGKQITLSNSQVSNYQTWTIADFSHDNSGNTVDLIQANTIIAKVFNNVDTNMYRDSVLRSWLKNTYINGFSADVISKIQTMVVSSGNITLNDNIKILSCTEVGFSAATYAVEGTQYPLFTDDNSREYFGARTNWWLRTRPISGSGLVYICNSSGRLTTLSLSESSGVVPAIRFA